jgi:ABC-type lipoprotein export system ATPase subunit
VLHSLSFEVPAGTFVSVQGPSGCGKSTLLNLFSGLDVPNEGRVLVGSQSLSELSPPKRDNFRLQNMAFVFQFHHLLPTLNVLENVCFAAFEKQNKSRLEIVEEAKELLCHLDLGTAFSKMPSQLSGGMQARVGFARALLAKPRVLFADEPTGNLDSHSGEALLGLLCDYQKSSSCTLVLVTHDPAAAQRASLQLHLKDGRLV